MMRFRCIILALILASIGMVAIAISENTTYKANNTLNNTLNDTPNNNLLLTNFSISGSVDFSGEIFENAVDFNRTTIEGDVNFNGTLLKGAKYGHPDMRWDNIKDLQHNDDQYLALIAKYEWLTKYDNYNWSNDANYCYIDYRNKKLGLPDILGKGVWILTGSNWFFAILLFILFLIFIIPLIFGTALCRDQSIFFGYVPFLRDVYIMPPFVLWISPDKMWDLFAFISSGYGRRPLYTIFLSLLVIFVFSLYICLEYFKKQSFWRPLWQSLGRSFWLSAAIFFSAPVKNEDKLICDQMGSLVVIERALGWLLLAVFIAVLSNVIVIRSGLS